MAYVVLDKILKHYPRVKALDEVSFELEQGEVHALLGENGAGKSTLMKVLYGMVTPDSGTITIDGQRVAIQNPVQAIGLGIGMVHQHFMLAESMTVLENIIAGSEPGKNGIIDYKQAKKEVETLVKRFSFEINVNRRVEELSVGEKQRVEILTVLYHGAKILILDEPTAVLTPLEVDGLFRVLRQLREEGRSIIIITHKLYEVTQIADRVTVMRDGLVTGYADPKTSTPLELATLMVGREIKMGQHIASKQIGELCLNVEGLRHQHQGITVLDHINLQVHHNEILGIAGVEGNGQTELIEALTGVLKPDQMMLSVDGQVVSGTVYDFIKAGIGHVPEDRLKSAVVVDMPIYSNLILGYHDNKKYKNGHVYNYKKIKEYGNTSINTYNIKAPDADTTIGELSGGNQQKVVIARVFEQSPKVIICAQPTRGVDVGASEYIHKKIRQFRDTGHSVLLISADLQEVQSLSDYIAVIYKGKIVVHGKSTDFTDIELGIYMTGGTPEKEGSHEKAQ